MNVLKILNCSGDHDGLGIDCILVFSFWFRLHFVNWNAVAINDVHEQAQRALFKEIIESDESHAIANSIKLVIALTDEDVLNLSPSTEVSFFGIKNSLTIDKLRRIVQMLTFQFFFGCFRFQIFYEQAKFR